jgi:predicted XRE-type DNA-binding protein
MKEAIATSVKSSGNVFEDLGFERGEAANMLIRADLMIEIERYIREEGMSQRRAAEFFGVHQGRINDLMNGRIEKFSVDMLLNMLRATGKRVRLEVESMPQ